MQYLVEAARGPLPASPEQAITLLEGTVIPHFEYMMRLEREKNILCRWHPGRRSSVCVHHRGRVQRRGRPDRPRHARMGAARMDCKTIADRRSACRNRAQGRRDAEGRASLTAA